MHSIIYNQNGFWSKLLKVFSIMKNLRQLSCVVLFVVVYTYYIDIETFSSEKKELINEIVCLKKQAERHELDSSRKDTSTEKLRTEFDNTLVSLKETENKVNILQAQVSRSFSF